MIPYGRQTIGDEDMAAVEAVLKSDWLTTGPQVAAFEQAVAAFTGTRYAVAVSNGTAALHAAMVAIGVGPGDEVIIPAITFAATANAVVYVGAKPVFADVDPDTLLMDPDSVSALLSTRTKAVIAVDYAGQPCEYDRLREVIAGRGISLLADACHALGGSLNGVQVGALADLSTFSFHPVKPMTTGEGGMIVTDREEWANRARVFRNHGITTDFRQREAMGSWAYDMVSLGFNYRLPDVLCALGIAQLKRLPEWRARREEIARQYNAAFAGSERVRPLCELPLREHGRHLYVVRISGDRDEVFRRLRSRGIGVNVHYKPVFLHTFYVEKFPGEVPKCPVAEAVFREILSLPIYPAMTDADVHHVIAEVEQATSVK